MSVQVTDIRLTPWQRVRGLFQPQYINRAVQENVAFKYLDALSRSTFKAAEDTRQNYNWSANYTDINAVLRTELEKIRNRSNWLTYNNPYGKSAVNTFINYCVGVGFDLQMGVYKTVKTTDNYEVVELDAFNDYTEDLFKEWAEDVDIAGSDSSPESFCEAQSLILRRWIADGEVFIHMGVDKSQGTVPLRIQFVDPQALDTWKTQWNGNPIILGVEVDKRTYRPLAYWVRSANAANTGYVFDQDSVRIPAKDMVHAFIRLFPRQVRGLPWFHAVSEKLFQIDEYANAQLVRNKIAAFFGVLFTGAGAGGGKMFSDAGDAAANGGSAAMPKDPDGNPIRNLAPGMIGFLPQGADVKQVNPSAPEGEYDTFQKSNLIAVGGGIEFGMSYQGLTRDTSQTTFASGRDAGQRDNQGYRPIQRMIGRKALSPIFRRWMDLAVLSGAITAPSYEVNPKFWQRHQWLPGGWSWGINPTQEVDAAASSMGARITTLADECGQLGLDWKTQLRKARKIEKFAESIGLKVPVDWKPESFSDASKDQQPTDKKNPETADDEMAEEMKG